MTIPGMPVAIPPVTVRQCITDKERVPKPQSQNGKCETSAVKSEGQQGHLDRRRTGQRPMEGSGEVTYSGDTMQGKSTFQMKNRAQRLRHHRHPEHPGQAVGDCKNKLKSPNFIRVSSSAHAAGLGRNVLRQMRAVHP